MIYWLFQPLIQVQQSYTLTENSFSAKHSSSSLLLQTQLHVHPLELNKFYNKNNKVYEKPFQFAYPRRSVSRYEIVYTISIIQIPYFGNNIVKHE